LIAGVRRQLIPAIVAFLAFTVLVGLLYPLAITGIAQVAFSSQADGSLVKHGSKVVGSSLIGQDFSAPEYFHPRPSSAGDGYDAMSSSASNLGPSNPEFLRGVRERIRQYRAENSLAPSQEIPADAVMGSGSGLDPMISPENARLQARRVADARGISLDEVMALVSANTSGRSLGFLGEPGVNVLELNLALDKQA
jgi:potassium-transporting ATPase KdpC subunit